MDQLRNLADNRLLRGCTYCIGGPEHTRDHVPSRVFLDAPYPTNLPVVPACLSCNNGFSLDEAYLACLIECAVSGSTDPCKFERTSVGAIISRSAALRARLASQKTTVGTRLAFMPEADRVCKIIEKLARGHVAFEFSLMMQHAPSSLTCVPLHVMSDEQLSDYDAADVVEMLGEVGSRDMQRLYVIQAADISSTGHPVVINAVLRDWAEVQEGRYRYLVSDDGEQLTVKIVIREYLACAVTWTY